MTVRIALIWLIASVLSPARGWSAAASTVRSVTSGAVLAVGRSSTLPEIIAALGGSPVPKIASAKRSSPTAGPLIPGRRLTME